MTTAYLERIFGVILIYEANFTVGVGTSGTIVDIITNSFDLAYR